MIITIGCMLLVTSAFSQDRQPVPVLYPKDGSVVGNKVNLVLDPSDIAWFRVEVNGNGYPAIDTARGAHALQGLAMQPGRNVIIVNVLSASADQDKKSREKAPTTVVASRTVTVFNSEGFFGAVPSGFTRDPFHTREHEATCGSCHRLEVADQDKNHAKPSDVLCFACHQKVPTGKEIHGPAALWNCLSCHNPELYPAKYAFTSVDPWKVTKYTQTVEPMTFTISTAGLFGEASATLVSKPKTKEAFTDVLNYVRQNPADKVRLEVHTDATPLKLQKTKAGKLKGFKDNQALTAARARALSALLRESVIDAKKLVAVGMGEKLPKSANKTPEARELNNRIEIVVYPSDVKVVNSQKLPVLKDRERVVVSLAYAQGPQIKKLRVLERIPIGMTYIKGSGYLKGRSIEPKQAGGELVWELGNMDPNFAENVYYTLKKAKNAGTVPLDTRVSYRSYEREQARDFDPSRPTPRGATISETCDKCHPGMLDRKFKHGPVAGGYCTLCHDPHASERDAWLRKPVWELCTTCHPDQGLGVHVVAGFITGYTHPTKGKKDRSRPGKGLSCVSCHDPHRGEHQYLFAYDIKVNFDLCQVCHSKK